MSKLNLYRKLKEISAVRFHEIKFDGNIKFIDKDYEDGKKYTALQLKELQDAWIILYDEYFERTDSTELRSSLRNKKRTSEMLLEINLIENIIDVLKFLDDNLEYLPDDVFLNTVNSLSKDLSKVNKRLVISVTEPIKDQIQRCNDVLEALKTRYKLLHKQDQNVQEADIMLFYKIKGAIEELLQRNLDENVNMLQWISYEKDYKKKAENRLSKKKHGK